jgi:glucosamine 6-phosphate synthetase-like amidotransferase/phosphosugar isomerase protein
MADQSGRYWIAFSGEIYNYRELREELKQHGFRFRSDTETDVNALDVVDKMAPALAEPRKTLSVEFALLEFNGNQGSGDAMVAQKLGAALGTQGWRALWGI